MISDLEEQNLRELGKILRNSILPKKEIEIIVSTLESFADSLIYKDEERASEYLRELAKELSLQIPKENEKKDDFETITNKMEEFVTDIILKKDELLNENFSLKENLDNQTKETLRLKELLVKNDIVIPSPND
ncbi:MAG: hypothetical protein Athens071416_462 [Parcubacteria group bacterium Athens0714_16]|nr:MAG: hypothetical protein Athens071416_462 [Parcubacteria group bacterium Athens0714_16]